MAPDSTSKHFNDEKNLSIFIVVLYSSISFCQTKITIDSLQQYTGEKSTFCSEVYSVKFLEQFGKQPAYLDEESKYPDNPLTVVIFGEDRKNFKEAPEVMSAGKGICVTREIKEIKGRPETLIDTPLKYLLRNDKRGKTRFNRNI